MIFFKRKIPALFLLVALLIIPDFSGAQSIVIKTVDGNFKTVELGGLRNLCFANNNFQLNYVNGTSESIGHSW
jgi:hypothetical protein